MSEATFKQDINAMYRLADQVTSLDALVPSLCEVLRKHQEDLQGITYSYRLQATDTNYSAAFSLDNGAFSDLAPDAKTDVTITGLEKNLLSIFQRKLNPAMALMLGKVKLTGSKNALLKLAKFL